MMARNGPSPDRRNRLAAILMVGGALLLAAAAIAEIVYGAASPHEAHRNLGDIGRGVIPGAVIFLFGSIFLANNPGDEDAAAETLPWIRRPRVRRRIASAYFVLGAAIILFSVVGW